MSADGTTSSRYALLNMLISYKHSVFDKLRFGHSVFLFRIVLFLDVLLYKNAKFNIIIKCNAFATGNTIMCVLPKKSELLIENRE